MAFFRLVYFCYRLLYVDAEGFVRGRCSEAEGVREGERTRRKREREGKQVLRQQVPVSLPIEIRYSLKCFI